MDSKKKKTTTIKKFLNIDGLSHLINLFTSFVASYAAPKNHVHDDRYAAKSHIHDDRYYTEGEVDSKLAGKADKSHTHTIGNITNLQSSLDGKSDKTHNHDSVYAKTAHTHSTDNITSGTLPISRGGTGGNTLTSAAASLKYYGLQGKTPIPENADLNTYDTAGVYVCPLDVRAKTIKNCPTGGRSFSLEVDHVLDSHDHIIQTLRQYNTARVYKRRSIDSGATWNAWQNIVMSNDTITAANVRDAGDGRTLTFNYSTSGMNSVNWYAAWNGSQLQSISRENAYRDLSARSMHYGGDMNSFTTPGTYTINNNDGFNNFPTNMYHWGILHVFVRGADICQLFLPDSAGGMPWFRTTGLGGWREWTPISTRIQAYFGTTVMDVYRESAGHNAGNGVLMTGNDYRNITGHSYDANRDNILIMNGDRDASLINASGVAFEGSTDRFWVQGGLWYDWKGTHCRINWCILRNIYP